MPKARTYLQNDNVCDYWDIGYATPSGEPMDNYCRKYFQSLPDGNGTLLYCGALIANGNDFCLVKIMNKS